MTRPPFIFLFLFSVCVLGGCAAHTDYGGRQRLTDQTAYTLAPGEALVGVGLVGNRMDNLGASVRLEWSPFVPGLELGTNLAHDALPCVNFYAKYTVVDSRWLGLGLRAGFKWIDFSNQWLLPDSLSLKEELSAAEMFMFPVSVTASLPLTDWFSFHAELSYTYTPVSGEIVLDDVHYNGGVRWHEVMVNPTLHFYPGSGVAILLGVRVPAWSSVYGEGYTEETREGLPGLRYGIQASLSSRLNTAELLSPWFGLHFAGEHFNLRVTGTWGLRFFDKSMFSAPGALAYVPMPGLDVFWRF